MPLTEWEAEQQGLAWSRTYPWTVVVSNVSTGAVTRYGFNDHSDALAFASRFNPPRRQRRGFVTKIVRR
jgi:hypothetical protein